MSLDPQEAVSAQRVQRLAHLKTQQAPPTAFPTRVPTELDCSTAWERLVSALLRSQPVPSDPSIPWPPFTQNRPSRPWDGRRIRTRPSLASSSVSASPAPITAAPINPFDSIDVVTSSPDSTYRKEILIVTTTEPSHLGDDGTSSAESTFTVDQTTTTSTVPIPPAAKPAFRKVADLLTEVIRTENQEEGKKVTRRRNKSMSKWAKSFVLQKKRQGLRVHDIQSSLISNPRIKGMVSAVH